MENNKFYVPNIEEFHIGFEYQEGIISLDLEKLKESNVDEFIQNIDNSKSDYEIIWIDKVINKVEDLKELCVKILSLPYIKTRVKYLDKEDIESLGFTQYGKTINAYFEWEGIHLREDGYHLNNIKLEYGSYNNKLRITFHYVSGEKQIHFEGIIKNKSELKKVLKMLNILK